MAKRLIALNCRDLIDKIDERRYLPSDFSPTNQFQHVFGVTRVPEIEIHPLHTTFGFSCRLFLAQMTRRIAKRLMEIIELLGSIVTVGNF